MMNGLTSELQKASHDPKVGAVVLTGAGRGFCSGGDITAMRARNEATGPAPTLEDRVANLRHGEEASRLLHEMPKVTIAAVNGPAAGAGLSIAMACDIRIASDNARFGTAFARVGFSGDYGGTWALTELVGSAKARELYFLPDVIDANEAVRIGLANRVVPAASFKDESRNRRSASRTARPLPIPTSRRTCTLRLRTSSANYSIAKPGPDADRPDRGSQGSGKGVPRKARTEIPGALTEPLPFL